LELGSGPGHLAAAILAACRVSHYTAVDFSPAMHELARQHIGPATDLVGFETRDFRLPEWPSGLGPVDAVVTMQAAHEVRHKDHLPALLAQLHGLVAPDGLLLFADHYAGDGKNPALFPTREEQPIMLAKAGFSSVTPLLDQGGMTLYACKTQGSGCIAGGDDGWTVQCQSALHPTSTRHDPAGRGRRRSLVLP
jgi:SAM-dependent methyltransferase